jgi:excisionase family DNA binding protein
MLGFAPLRQKFAAPLLHGRRGLRVLRGGRDGLLSVRDVAEELGVCTATVYRLCADGQLAHVRILNAVRVTPRDLADFIDRQRHGGPAGQAG